MEQFDQIMEKVNAYIQDPYGLITVCTAPIIAYYVVKIYIKPRLLKNKNPEKE